MIIKKIVGILTSLRLTVILLAFSIILVFVGTLAQVDEGLYGAQAHYFKRWFVLGVDLFGHKLPLILPGGYLIGTGLLVNLVAAHVYRFQFKAKKIGIQLAHAGVILLLVGQLATDILAREMQLRFVEGEKRSYSESAADYELIFNAGQQETAIPATLLTPGQDLKISSLPFTIRVKTFWKNSGVSFRAPMMKSNPLVASNGLALSFDFSKSDDVKTMDQKNIPTAIIDLISPAGVLLGDWVVSGWTGDAGSIEAVTEFYQNQVGPEMARKIAGQLAVPQSLELDNKKYMFVLRPARIRHNFSLTLLKATHTVYPGTDIPKDFRSRVLVDNSATGEKREVEISMNHPLRYGGYTFYQYQMTAGEMAERQGITPSSVLSVVRNPSWLTPYIGCGMVGIGLLIQFLYHLVGFVSKRKTV